MKTISIFFFAVCCLAAELVHFQSKSHLYEADIPAGWLAWDFHDDLLIANYREEQGFHGGLLPPGGARIVAEPKPAKVTSKNLEDWVSFAVSATDPKDLISRTRKSIGKVCIEVHKRDEVGPHFYYEEISCYFESGRRGFVVTLEYQQDDPRAPDYRSAYETVIRSFKAR